LVFTVLITEFQEKKREKKFARFLHEIPLSRKNVEGCLKLVKLHIWFTANLVKASYE
jgi:hypothetical protein